MLHRWRGRNAGLAIGVVALAALVATGFTGAGFPDDRRLILRGPGGDVLLSHPIEAGASVGLRYRNSLYGTLAEEWFVVTDDEQLRLEKIRADELAVLEEYYEIDGPATLSTPDESRRWRGEPRTRLELRELRVAATDLGERTLLVSGLEPVELWHLVDDDRPTVTLTVEAGSQ